MTVLNAIKKIIDERKQQKRIPHCAMIEDVAALLRLPAQDIKKELDQLKNEGKISLKTTINSSSIYLNN